MRDHPAKILTFIVLVLGALAGLVVGQTTPGPWGQQEISLITIAGLACVLPIFAAAYGRRFYLFNPLTALLLSIFLGYVVGGYIIVWNGGVQRHLADTRHLITPSYILILIAIAGIYAGTLFGQYQFAPERNKHMARLFAAPKDPTTVFIWSMVLLAAVTVFFLSWFYFTGLPFKAMFAILEDASYNRSNDFGVLLFSFREAWLPLILIGWDYAPNRFWKRITFVLWLLVLVVIALMANRGYLFLTAATLPTMIYLHKRQQPSLRVIVLATAVVLFLTAALVIARRTGVASVLETSDTTSLRDELVLEFTERTSLPGLMLATDIFPEHHDYIGFSYFSEIATTLTPRFLWPEKPDQPRLVGSILRTYYPTPSVANTPGFIGVYYAVFGPLGAFVALALLSVMSSYIYQLWRSKPEDTMRRVMLAISFGYLVILVHRGDISFFLVRFGFAFGPIILVWFLSHYVILSRQSTQKLKPLDYDADFRIEREL